MINIVYFFEVLVNLPFRAMVSDLDGTLLTPEHLVGDLTIDTLRALEQKKA